MDFLDTLVSTWAKLHVKLHTTLMRPRFRSLESVLHPQVDITNPHCISIGHKVEIRPFTWIYAITNDRGQKDLFSPSIEIRDGTKIGRFCHITCSNQLIIEENVFITEGVLITDSIHSYEDVTMPIVQQALISQGPIIIGSGAWIGNGSQIVGKVRIGKNSVVASHCFVDKDVPDYSVVAGVPGRIIKRYDFEQREWVKVDEPLVRLP